jgi:predicted DNA-binding transcriptional regulator AlpA
MSDNVAVPTPQAEDDRLIDTDYIIERILPVSRVTFWKLRKNGFPPGLRIAPNRIAWRLSDVRRWIATRPAA